MSRTREVIAYHDDASQEGRPLFMLLGGAGLAMVSLGFIAMMVYRTWYAHELSSERGYFAVSLLFVFYVLGVFLFSYAYELYDLGAAFRTTLIVSFVSVVAIILVIGSLALLSRLKDGASGAADAASSEVDDSVLGLIGAFMGSSSRDDERNLRARMRDGTAPLLINCHGCGQMFQPLPPNAECAYCGRAAVTG